MTNDLEQTIKEELKRLPRENQMALSDFDWIKAVEIIGKNYLLKPEEINALQAETSLVLLGIEDGYSYPFNIKNNVGIEIEKAEKIAAEAEEKIFGPIYENLQEIIKNELKDKNIKPEQNMEFILSGGDYSVFLRRDEARHEENNKDELLGASNIIKTKNKLLE